MAPVLKRFVGRGYKRAIGTVEVHGEIVPYAWRPVGVYTVASDVRGALEAMAKDDAIKAAIVDVNSPGGAIVASREIARAIDAFPKPAVAWVRDYGASGAYEVAAACRKIVADPYSLVGSVGVILPRFELVDALAKIGVRPDVLKAGKWKDLGQPFRRMTDEERAILQGHLDRAHEGFLADVARRRGLKPDALAEIKTGLVFFGEQAQQLGLVDRLGGWPEAIALCEQLGAFAHDEVVPFRRSGAGGFLNRIIDLVSGASERIVGRAGAAFAEGVVGSMRAALEQTQLPR